MFGLEFGLMFCWDVRFGGFGFWFGIDVLVLIASYCYGLCFIY